tara:strand:- start:1127 stop:1945 length:819 start_codon:yes stop_codon:yes gene_type:complete
MILAIESSSSVCSVSLQTESGYIIDRWTDGRAEHSKKLVSFIGELLEEASGSVEQGMRSLQKVIISNGPGSYTGLRIAGSALRGILFNRKVKLWAASTLAGIACAIFKEQEEWAISGPSALLSAADSINLADPAFLRPTFVGAQLTEAVIHVVIDARGGFSYYQPFALEQFGLQILAEPKRVANSTIVSALHSNDKSFLVGASWANFIQSKSTPIQVGNQELKQFFHARNLLKLLLLPSKIGLEAVMIDRLEPYYLSNNQVNNSNIPTSSDS